MKPRLAVSNASPLIALERIGRLDLVPIMFERIVVPPAVAQEVGPAIMRSPGIGEQPLRRPIDPRVTAARLDAGESEAIGLAIESGADQIVLDDPARRLARTLGLPLIGTLGVLLAAKERRVIAAIGPLLAALIETGFRVDDQLYRFVLADAGEG